MHSSVLAATLVAAASVASAQQSVVTLPVPGIPASELIGSIISSNSQTTTYSLVCGNDDPYCGIPDGLVYTQEGSSSIRYTLSLSEDDTSLINQVGCDITSVSTGACSATWVEVNATATVTSSESTTFTAATDIGYLAVSLTAGALPSFNSAIWTSGAGYGTGDPSMLSTSAPPHTSKPAETSKSVITSASVESSNSTRASTSGASVASVSHSSSVSTGGMPAITPKAQLVAGGALALLALAGL